MLAQITIKINNNKVINNDIWWISKPTNLNSYIIYPNTETIRLFNKSALIVIKNDNNKVVPNGSGLKSNLSKSKNLIILFN